MMKKTSPGGKDVYAEVTDLLIEMMAQDDLPPWRKTWTISGPASYLTGKEYRGGNSLILMFVAMFRGYTSSYWAGWGEIKSKQKEAEAKGLPFEQWPQIKKGAKAAPLIIPGYIHIDKHDKKTGEKTTVVVPRFRSIKVWNEDQLLNWPRREAPVMLAREAKTNDEIEAILAARPSPCEMSFGQFNPCYAPRQDTVFMPPIGQFKNEAEYYATLAHEIVHSTGHATRLEREGITKIDRTDNKKYSQEELVAEIGASILMNQWGMNEHDMASAAVYLKGWAKYLQDNPHAMLTACQEATKAVDFILGIERVYEEPVAEPEAV